MGPVLVAGHRTLVDPHLPEHRVAAHRHVATAGPDVRVDGVACGGSPVLVVADPEHQVVALQGARFIEVRRHGEVEPVAGPLGPFDEPALVGEPSGRTDRRAVAVLESIPLEDLAVGVGHLAETHGTRLAVVTVDLGTIEEASSPGTPEGHAMATGVEAGPAPGVVRVPGVGRQHQQGALLRLVRPYHEAGVGDVAPRRRTMGSQGHQVEAARPVGADRDLERHGPPTPDRVGVGRCRHVLPGQALGSPHGQARASPTLHDHVVAFGLGRNMHRHRLAGPATQVPGIGLDLVEEGDLVAHRLNGPWRRTRRWGASRPDWPAGSTSRRTR